MVLRKLLVRLAGLNGTKDQKSNAKGKEKEKEHARDHIAIIVHHAAPASSNVGNAISQGEMETSASNQDICLFFARLPLEIRRLIYREVWRGYLESACRQIPMPMSRISSASAPTPSSPSPSPSAAALLSSDLGLHIYSDGSGGTKLGHTLCRVHDCLSDQGDRNRISIQPWMYQEGIQPPMWLWRAWVMRQHWNRHWKCQSAVMKRWSPETGAVQQTEPSPFLSLFLTCKMMYWEAIACCFENVTPIFTSSKDAYHFFVLNPHPFAGYIRTLELNFTDQNDHLFLHEIQRPVLDLDDQDSTTPQSELGDFSTLPHSGHHDCSTPGCYLNLFNQKLLDRILDRVQAQIPSLRDLVITITGRMEHAPILERFSYVPGDENDGEAAQTQCEKQRETPTGCSKWALPGNLTISFEADGMQYHVRDGGKMVRQRID